MQEPYLVEPIVVVTIYREADDSLSAHGWAGFYSHEQARLFMRSQPDDPDVVEVCIPSLRLHDDVWDEDADDELVYEPGILMPGQTEAGARQRFVDLAAYNASREADELKQFRQTRVPTIVIAQFERKLASPTAGGATHRTYWSGYFTYGRFNPQEALAWVADDNTPGRCSDWIVPQMTLPRDLPDPVSLHENYVQGARAAAQSEAERAVHKAAAAARAAQRERKPPSPTSLPVKAWYSVPRPLAWIWAVLFVVGAFAFWTIGRDSPDGAVLVDRGTEYFAPCDGTSTFAALVGARASDIGRILRNRGFRPVPAAARARLIPKFEDACTHNARRGLLRASWLFLVTTLLGVLVIAMTWHRTRLTSDG